MALSTLVCVKMPEIVKAGAELWVVALTCVGFAAGFLTGLAAGFLATGFFTTIFLAAGLGLTGVVVLTVEVAADAFVVAKTACALIKKTLSSKPRKSTGATTNKRAKYLIRRYGIIRSKPSQRVYKFYAVSYTTATMALSAQEQHELVLRWQKGDKQAFTLLYTHFAKPIYSFVYYKVHHKETAEDLVSTAFMKAVAAVNSFNVEKGTFSAWMYQIARNTVVNHYRAQKPEFGMDEQWDIASKENVAGTFATKEEVRQVQTYLAKLPAEQQEIMTMRLWDSMSYAEIAEILGKSEASCKMSFSRTIKKIREELPVAAVLALLLWKI